MPAALSTTRLKWLLWLMLAWVGGIVYRLVGLQVVHHDELLRLAQQQQQHKEMIPALRGPILDRFGQPLAKTLPAESICVNPRKIPDVGVAADILSSMLEMDRATLADRLTTAKLKNLGFMWVKRKVTPEEATRLRSLSEDWLELRPDMRRYYPHGEIGSHVIGSTSLAEDDTDRGSAGLELEFDDQLSGRPGEARVYTDVRQNAYDRTVARAPEPGAAVTTTLDPNLQYVAEKELDKALISSGAKRGSVIAMNPYNGEILAMANTPRFDPNRPPEPGDPPEARSDIAVGAPFEPGSVLKIITLSAALETTSLRPESIINCLNGSINLHGRVIHDEHRYGLLSMADVLAKSSNIGAIQIGLQVGDRNLYDYERKFGFGRKTGIDLPGESAGQLRRVEQWDPASIGSVAMGHEIGVTSIQLALAGSAIANGGMLVKPRIVLSTQKPGAAVEKFPVEPSQRILRPETTILMRQMMEGVVLHGTGKNAILKGYTSGGKTGSAMIYDRELKAYTHRYNASFLGFAPVSNPQIVIVVTLEATTGGTAGFGGPVAAPVFREVATPALRMLDVPKDLPEDVQRASVEPAPSKSLDKNLAMATPVKRRPGSRSVSSVTQPPVHAGASVSAGAPVSSLDGGSSSTESSDRRRFFVSPAGR